MEHFDALATKLLSSVVWLSPLMGVGLVARARWSVMTFPVGALPRPGMGQPFGLTLSNLPSLRRESRQSSRVLVELVHALVRLDVLRPRLSLLLWAGVVIVLVLGLLPHRHLQQVFRTLAEQLETLRQYLRRPKPP